MFESKLGKSFFWGALIGSATGLITIFDIEFFKLLVFPIRGGGFPFYSIKVVPMIVALVLLKHKGFKQFFFSSLLFAFFISLFSEIVLSGFYQLIVQVSNPFEPLIFIHNIQVMSISALCISLASYPLGRLIYAKPFNKPLSHRTEIIDSETIE